MEEGRIGQIEEMQGWDGAYSLSEYVIQHVWARGEFLREGLRLEDGRRLVVSSQGTWNRSGGPDFRGAEFFLDGVSHQGDVEVHAREGDWAHHRHAEDPLYSGVALHVVLFPSRRTSTTGWGGAQIPVLVLLPHLLRDLEDYALDFALERSLPLGAGVTGERGPTLVEPWAREQFEAKLERVRSRVQAWGWEEAAHCSALEVLGFSSNRVPMLALGRRHPWGLGRWPSDSRTLMEWMQEIPGWMTVGRPANHAQTRVRQYADWLRAHPQWPQQMRALPCPELRGPSERSGSVGRETWSAWSARQAGAWGCPTLGQTRWNTLLLEAAVPLLASVGAWPLETAYKIWASAPPAETGHRVWDAVWLWHREMHPEQPLNHGLVQAWRRWRAQGAPVKG